MLNPESRYALKPIDEKWGSAVVRRARTDGKVATPLLPPDTVRIQESWERLGGALYPQRQEPVSLRRRVGQAIRRIGGVA